MTTGQSRVHYKTSLSLL